MLDVTPVVCSLLILSFLSIWVNSFCIYIINVLKSYRSKPASIFVLNLFATHLFQACVVLPTYTGKKWNIQDPVWSNFFAEGFLFTYLFSFYGVSLSTMCIGLDRFLAAFLLTRYNKYVTTNNVMKVLLFLWVYVTLLCLVPFIHTEPTTAHEVVVDLTNQTLRTNTSKELNSTSGISVFPQQPGRGRTYYKPQDGWTVFMLFFNAALPLFITASSYVYVIIKLTQFSDTLPVCVVRHRDASAGDTETPRGLVTTQVKEIKQYKQVTYVALALCSTYFILCGPSIIYYTILSVCEHQFVANWNDSPTEKIVVFVIKYMFFLTALISPIIYSCRHPKVKRFFRRWHVVADDSKGSIETTDEEGKL